MVTTANTALANSIWINTTGEVTRVCRWGHAHTGDYRDEDVMQCGCEHDSPLLLLGPEQAVCGDCGRSWRVEDKRA